jgi:hypothetical protein
MAASPVAGVASVVYEPEPMILFVATATSAPVEFMRALLCGSWQLEQPSCEAGKVPPGARPPALLMPYSGATTAWPPGE